MQKLARLDSQPLLENHVILYELICKMVFDQLFDYEADKYTLNIFNYLSLEYYLQINKEELRTAIFYNFLENGERIRPFSSIDNWKGDCELNSKNIPDWWNAYNCIKHDAKDINEYANLINAIYSLASVFLLIRKVYNDGLISGYLHVPSNEPNVIDHMYPIKTSEVFIGEILKSQRGRLK